MTKERVGLCSVCQHVRVIQNQRGSTFYLCRLSESDPTFRKYPPLPVVRCRGFRPAETNGTDAAPPVQED